MLHTSPASHFDTINMMWETKSNCVEFNKSEEKLHMAYVEMREPNRINLTFLDSSFTVVVANSNDIYGNRSLFGDFNEYLTRILRGENVRR